MTRRALLLLLALAGPAAAAEPPGAVAALADGVATALGAPPEGHPGVALWLRAPADGLAPSLGAALAGALGRAGWVVSPLDPGADPEAAARAAGADWLLHLVAGAPDGAELAAVGEAVPLWSSFFLQGRPGARAAPPRPVSARAPVDASAALLLRPAARADLSRLALRRLVRLPYPVLALAAGDAGEPGASILLVEPGAVRLLDAAGRELASRPLEPGALSPARLPAAAAVLGPLGAGRIGVAASGATGGLVLVRRGARLEPAGSLPMAPLAAGDAGVLFGAFADGRGALQDLLAVGPAPAAPPRSARLLAGVAAAPRGRSPAFAALRPGGELELLGPSLAPLGQVQGVGAGFALADLDGDGAAELVASQPTAGEPDRLRVIRLGGAGRSSAQADEPPAFRSGPVEGQLLCGAAADLTGDGLDDVLLAAVLGAPGEAQATELWLLTVDGRATR